MKLILVLLLTFQAGLVHARMAPDQSATADAYATVMAEQMVCCNIANNDHGPAACSACAVFVPLVVGQATGTATQLEHPMVDHSMSGWCEIPITGPPRQT